ncbi:hypothetical protein [Domibacillus indicus]|uniref:hypothetical protein n=1 Tax=Domibacillus indicus TaxID=1437523 RepID=UPI000617BF52|nr:hypothetical protein [Domibacillus indicus]
MTKTLLFCFLALFLAGPVQALSWAYPFVVFDGRVYEVTEETIEAADIGRKIGEVKRTADPMTGEYYGDASNSYSPGTGYFELNGTSVQSAIAVEAEQHEWKKAVYAHDAPFHWMNLAAWLPVMLAAAAGFVIWKWRKRKISRSY